MPIYTFVCEDCDHIFDRLMKIDETWMEPCPKCGANKIRKIIAPSNFHLKGTGWYKTDYKKKTD